MKVKSERGGPPVVDISILVVVVAAAGVTLARLAENIRLLPDLSAGMVLMMAAAAVLYILAHVLRTLRLYLFMTGGLVGSSVPFASLLGFQALFSLLTFGAPLKLGDGLRAVELCRLANNDLRAIYALWFDRIADSILIIALLATLGALHLVDPASLGLLWITIGFLVVSIVLLIAAPSALAAVTRACVAATSVATMRILRTADFARKLLERAPQLDRGTFSLVAVLTLGVWCLEIATVSLVAAALATRASNAPERFMIILARLFQFGPPVTPEGAAYFLVACSGLLALTMFTVTPYLRLRREGFRLARVRRTYAFDTPFGLRALVKGRIR